MNRFLLCLLLGFFISCSAPEKTSENIESAESTEVVATTPKVEILFDGTNLDQWRNYKSDAINPQWQIENGTLTLAEKGGGDLMTRAQYDNFILELDWKISKNGNSGIFYHVVEADSLPTVYFSGPEMQILDDDGHPDGKFITHRSGDNYDLQACSEETVNPPGEWNSVILKVDGSKVEHWLNGTMVVSFDQSSDEWKAQLAKSKFADWPMYAKSSVGHIALQDHGDQVWFRNIKITSL